MKTKWNVQLTVTITCKFERYRWRVCTQKDMCVWDINN